MLDSCEDGFVTNSLLVGVAFERFHFRFGLEFSDVQVEFRNLFRSLSLSPITVVERIALSFPLNPRLMYIFELEEKGSGAATITYHKTCLLVVCPSGPTRLTGKFAFKLFPFYPNQCRFSGGPPLCGIIENPVDI